MLTFEFFPSFPARLKYPVIEAILILFFPLASAYSQHPLVCGYPGLVKRVDKNMVRFVSGDSLPYDDGKQKEFLTLLESPDIQDQFFFRYNREESEKNTDAGRIRNEAFFRKIYGENPDQVRQNLVTIVWCPKLVNQKIKFSKVNGASKAIEKVSSELDEHPEWKNYLSQIGGTFNWRYINGTKRLSNHSFGITLDINTRHSNYWQWDCKCTDEANRAAYRNKIPIGIVSIFEKNGFIWGGRWTHYDTMHFEYRPEFFCSEGN